MSLPQKDSDSALLAAIDENDPAAVARLLSEGASPNAKDEDGETALGWSIGDDKLEIVKQLVDAGADLDCRWKGDGTTALIVAVAYGHTNVARLLIFKGANVNVCGGDWDDALGAKSPLMLAVEGENLELGKLLLQHGAKPDQFTDREGSTALHYAASGQPEFVELLLEYGADINARMNCLGCDDTALEIAFGQSDDRCARALFREAQQRHPNALGTPMHAAAYLGDLSIAQTLVAHGVEPRDYCGRTPIHWVAGQKQPSLPQLILECAAMSSDSRSHMTT